MGLFPQYRFERYKKISENSFAITPELVTGFSDIVYKGGIETNKDVLEFKIPTYRLSNGSWQRSLGKLSKENNLFSIDDEIKFYAYYGSALPDDKDDALLISSRVASFKSDPAQDKRLFTIKTYNRTEELLNTMIPFSTRAATGVANTSPTAIKQMINRLNQFNKSKQVFAYLTTETNPITGSPGYIQATKSDGTDFPTIDYNETWKPTHFNIEKISSPEYTEDESAGEYVFYVQYSKVLPQFQGTYGETINEVVWKSKSLVNTGSLTEGVDLLNVKISIDTKDIQNLLIVDAGTDKRGAGITGVAYDVTSIGKFGAKTGYYSRSRRVFSEIWAQEIREWESSSGSTQDPDGMPPDSSYPINMTFSGRDDFTGSFTGSTLSADDKSEWNQYLRDEARWQAVTQAEKALERLGEPRYSLVGDLPVGSNNIIAGDLYEFIVPSYGWDGTANNPSYRLRVKDIQHTFNQNGWETQLECEEDEKVISEALGNTKTNVG